MSLLAAACARVDPIRLDAMIERSLIRMARYLRQPLSELEAMPLNRYNRLGEYMQELLEAESGKGSRSSLSLPNPDDEG